MANFEILEDYESTHRIRNKKVKKSNDVCQEYVFQKKYVTENRGILQAFSNGVRVEAKQLKSQIDHETESRVQEIVEIDNLDEDILNLDVHENNEELKEEQEMPKTLLFVTEYRKDIWKYLNNFEKTFAFPKSKYMLKQTDLSWNTRSILIDWLSSVAEEYRLCNETFHLSVNYIDRFLNQISVVRNKFQLVGAAAMLLAGKIEEIYPVDVKEWAYLTGDSFTPKQILKMEQLIAKILKFRMQPPTICTFIEHFCQDHRLDLETTNLAMYISELVLLEGDEYLNHMPSKLAAACIVLARYTLSKEHIWPSKFKETSGYTLRQLSPLVQKQQKTFKDSPLKDQQAIQTKYKKERFCQVALLQPRKLLMEDFDDID